MRLAFCLETFEIGGIELNAVRWAERLDPARFQLTLVHFRRDGPLRPRYEALGVRLLHVPLRNVYGPAAIYQGARLARFLARERIQVFQAHDIYANIFGVPWARLAGVPAVVASRRWWRRHERPAQQIANRWAYRAAHRVLANSPSVAALLVREEGVPPGKIMCLPNFLAEDAFRPLPRPEIIAWRTRLNIPLDARVIGIVARLDQLKDHATLLRAFAQLQASGEARGVCLVCVGDGALRSELEALAGALRIVEQVRFPGTLTPPFNVHQLFDVSVLCSRSEGFPNVVLEAMAAARPLIATRVGGVPDAVQDGETGMLVAVADVEGLVRALRAVLTEPQRAHDLGLAARARARREYHEDQIIPRLGAWYESLAPQARP